MPAKKPVDLVKRDETKVDRRRREYRAESLMPYKKLTAVAPKELTGEVARSTWQETVRVYLTLDARIVSVLDRGLLIDYCIACDQLSQIDELRALARTNQDIAQEFLKKARGEEIDAKTMASLVKAANDTQEMFMRLDARADGKRKLLHTYRQSLMLTPRSRGGSSNVEEKPKETGPSMMEKIIEGEAKKNV
jgi:hypothetical protein